MNKFVRQSIKATDASLKLVSRIAAEVFTAFDYTIKGNRHQTNGEKKVENDNMAIDIDESEFEFENQNQDQNQNQNQNQNNQNVDQDEIVEINL